jgi:peptidoglycan/xylan/chitin deacetylase (PgdA/CDA1 family)
MKNLRNNSLLYLFITIIFFIIFIVCTKTVNTYNSKFPVRNKQLIVLNNFDIKEDLDPAIIPSSQMQVLPNSELSEEIDDPFYHTNKEKRNMKRTSSSNLDPRSIEVPVLMYHSINANSTNNLIITPQEFEKQISWLKDNGFTPLILDELYSMLTTGINVPRKPIVLTFDDGYEDNYTEAYSILKRYNFKATIFLITDAIGHAAHLKEPQIREMYANNIDFQSHTASHHELNSLSFKKQLEELIQSRDAINKMLIKNTDYLCYPVGKYNEDTMRALKAAGYKMAFTTKPGFAKLSDGLYKATRVRMLPGMSMQVLNKKDKAR